MYDLEPAHQRPQLKSSCMVSRHNKALQHASREGMNAKICPMHQGGRALADVRQQGSLVLEDSMHSRRMLGLLGQQQLRHLKPPGDAQPLRAGALVHQRACCAASLAQHHQRLDGQMHQHVRLQWLLHAEHGPAS